MGLQKLNSEEKIQLLAALTEAKRRGIEIPDHLLGKQEKIRWPLGSNGYFVHREGKAYIPTEPQGGFVNSIARFCLFYGSRGSGKSAAGAQKAMMKIKQGFSGAVLNPDFENFKSSTWPEFKQWIPWNLVQHKQRYRMEEGWEPHKPFTINFLNGAYARCKGLKDPDSARGPNINWLWYDEGGRDRSGLAWRLAIASVRVGFQPQAWVTATPAGLYHWMHDFFIEGDIPDEVKKLLEEVGDDRALLDYYHGTIDQNKANLDAGFHAAMLLAYPGGFLREQEIHGEFVEEGGTIGDRRWFNDRIVEGPFEGVDGRLRFWDMAATEKKIKGGKNINDPDETVGSLVGMVGDEFRIEDQISGFWLWRDIKENIKRTALADGPYVRIRIEEEPGSGGKNQVAAMRDFFKEDPDLKKVPFDVQGYRPEGDRVQLANYWFAEAAEGQWTVVEGEWNEGFFRQVDSFPLPGVHDDRVTSVSGARATLKPFSGTKDIDFLHL
jgi:phage terminase large subunit-like protein